MQCDSEKSAFAARARLGNCSHAYIIDGAAGIGKYEFALWCAQTLLCTGENQPCGRCQACVKAQNGEHPDVYTVGGERVPSVKDIRELIRKASLVPNDGEKQVFIVRNAGKMFASAQNAMLKLFEEPPKSVVVFLLTESRSSLLPTVLSRGQRINLSGTSDAEVAAEMRLRFPDASESRVAAAVRSACGNAGEAERYLSKESTELREKASAILTYAINNERYLLFRELLYAKYKREQLYALLDGISSLAASAAACKYGAGKGTEENVRAFAEKATGKSLVRIGEAVTECMIALENNANVTAASSKLAVDIAAAARVKPEGQ